MRVYDDMLQAPQSPWDGSSVVPIPNRHGNAVPKCWHPYPLAGTSSGIRPPLARLWTHSAEQQACKCSKVRGEGQIKVRAGSGSVRRQLATPWPNRPQVVPTLPIAGPAVTSFPFPPRPLHSLSMSYMGVSADRRGSGRILRLETGESGKRCAARTRRRTSHFSTVSA
eukprot:365630-Chlamydomonas_euryale.AAC.22